jgi:L-ascorbate 6-phosphate lactonase
VTSRAHPQAEGPGLLVRPLGQAGFLLTGAGRAVLLDPWLSADLETASVDNPDPATRAHPPVHDLGDLADLGPVDVVCCTHPHPDHLDGTALRELAAAHPQLRVVVPLPVVGDVVRSGVPAERVVGIVVEEPVTVAGVRVLALPAAHAMAADSFGGYTYWRDGEGRHVAVGYVVRLAGVTVFHAGDTVRHPGDAQRLRAEDVDVAILPVNGRDWVREQAGLVGNLHPAEAVDLAVEAGIPHLLPCHYDGVVGNTGNPADVVRAVLDRRAALDVHLLRSPGGTRFTARLTQLT